MGALDEAGQLLTVAQIARRMGLARQGVQRIVNELEKQGLLAFESNIDHKRAPLVTISTAGRQVMSKVNAAQAVWVNEIAAGLSERQLKQTVNMLETVREQSEQT